MKQDKFWKQFWVVCGGSALLCMGIGTGLFISAASRPNVAAVGAFFDATHDPFEGALLAASTTFLGGYMYQDALPLGFTQWHWQANGNWRSKEVVQQGSYALKAMFNEPLGSVGFSGPAVAIEEFHSLKLMVRPTEAVGDLFVELYNAKDQPLGRQSLAWYTASKKFTPDVWQEVVVPLSNLMGTSSTKNITGFSISGQNPGTAYVDSIQLSTTKLAHELWVAPAELYLPYNPFATSTPLTLPYHMSFDASDIARNWYSYYGNFKLEGGRVIAGPEPKQNTDAIAVLRGGWVWSDYAASATLKWGEVSVFAFLMRFVDLENYVACSFSRLGETMQIYQVKKGVSTLISQSPGLPVNDLAAWEDVTLEAKVQGNTLTCIVGGERLSATFTNMSARGTVGIESWDPNSEAAPHSIGAFGVKSP